MLSIIGVVVIVFLWRFLVANPLPNELILPGDELILYGPMASVLQIRDEEA